jgi:hypothetical protein
MEPDDIRHGLPVPAGRNLRAELSTNFAVLAAGGGPDHSLEETMKLTKHGLLATVAATALVAGAGAFAQQSPSAPSGSEIQGGAKVEKQEQMKGGAQTQQAPAKTQAQGQSAPDSKQEPRGQVQQQQQDMKPGQAQQKPGAKEPGQAQQPGQTQQPGQAQQPGAKQPGQAESGAKAGAKTDAKVELNSEQRTKISQTIKTQTNLKRVSRTEVNFTINVGAVVPRTIGLVVLPAPIVAIVPQFRGYLYIVVDDQLLIIHPTTYEIVAVLPA